MSKEKSSSKPQPIGEGIQKKGGVNRRPGASPPPPPKGQSGKK